MLHAPARNECAEFSALAPRPECAVDPLQADAWRKGARRLYAEVDCARIPLLGFELLEVCVGVSFCVLFFSVVCGDARIGEDVARLLEPAPKPPFLGGVFETFPRRKAYLKPPASAEEDLQVTRKELDAGVGEKGGFSDEARRPFPRYDRFPAIVVQAEECFAGVRAQGVAKHLDELRARHHGAATGRRHVGGVGEYSTSPRFPATAATRAADASE